MLSFWMVVALQWLLLKKKVFCRKVALPVTGSANCSATIDCPEVEYGPMGKVSSLGVFYP